MQRELGVGVVGLGWMGRLHARSMRALGERAPELGARVRLAAACDGNEAVCAEALHNLGFATACSRWEDLVADPAVDVVSICCPNFLHRDVAWAAAAGGKPFWIEKPMGTGVEQSRAIARAAREAGIVTAVGFNYRHAPAIERARQLIRDGRLGRVTNVRAWLIADYGSSPDAPLTWRHTREGAGSGVIGDLMSHGFDLVQYLTGRISEVSAVTGRFIPERPLPLGPGVGHRVAADPSRHGLVENEDYVALLARLDGGALATLEASRTAVGPRAEYVVEVYGTEGSLRWNFEHLNDLEVAIGRDREFAGYTRVMADDSFPGFSAFQPSPGTSMGFDDLKVVEAAQFVASVLSGEQLAPSVADGLVAAEIDDAALRSAEDGRWHQVPHVDGPTTFDATTATFPFDPQ